jgi:hypothetical protein
VTASFRQWDRYPRVGLLLVGIYLAVFMATLYVLLPYEHITTPLAQRPSRAALAMAIPILAGIHLVLIVAIAVATFACLRIYHPPRSPVVFRDVCGLIGYAHVPFVIWSIVFLGTILATLAGQPEATRENAHARLQELLGVIDAVERHRPLVWLIGLTVLAAGVVKRYELRPTQVAALVVLPLVSAWLLLEWVGRLIG